MSDKGIGSGDENLVTACKKLVKLYSDLNVAWPEKLDTEDLTYVKRVLDRFDFPFKLPSGRELPLERLPQRDDALIEQLYDLWAVGMRLGMFTAADWLKLRIPRPVQEVLAEVRAERAQRCSKPS